jgi:hypothetical protein
MLDHVFRRPSVRDRIRANPLGNWLPNYIGYVREGASQTRKPMPKAAAATVAIRSINVKRCRDGIMLWLRRVELSAPLWFKGFASRPPRPAGTA